MKRARIQVKKLAILSHRWMGVAFCVLFAWWFVSGIVMMYWDYPRVGPQQRLERAHALDPRQVRLAADEACSVIGLSRPPDEARLVVFDGRPLYRFRTGLDNWLVYADNGQRLTKVCHNRSLTVAAQHGAADLERVTEPRPSGSASWPCGPPKVMKVCGAGPWPAAASQAASGWAGGAVSPAQAEGLPHDFQPSCTDELRLTKFPADLLLRVASDWTGQPASSARSDILTAEDQWTVPGSFRAHRPLSKYSWPNGEEVYVSATTGEVVQHTTRASRLGAYFGAIPHWLYFTPLRKDQPLWSRVVIWLSGIGTVTVLLGLIAGIWMYSPSRRYRFNGNPSRIPYRGQKRLHTILGLFFGIVTCTWAFSGMMSMNPFPGGSRGAAGSEQITDALRGGKLPLAGFARRHPREALRQAPNAKEIELAAFAGEPVYLATEALNRSKIIPVSGNATAEFDSRRTLAIVTGAVRPTTVAEARLVTEYEIYYVDRHHRRPLPVLFVRLNDSGNSMYYVDLKTARVVQSYGSRSRWNRWLYQGLHSMDLPWLYKHRPAWDVFVLVLLLGGTALSVTSIAIGYRVVRRKLATVKNTILFFLCGCSLLSAADAPKIVVAGGPQPLWPQIVSEWQSRYPANPVDWQMRRPAEETQADLIFAYYPTADELRDLLRVSAKRSLGFPEESVTQVWKQPVDREASAQAAAYLDEGGVENGVRLLVYLYSLVRPGAPPVEPPLKGPQTGIYHPDAADIFTDYGSYRRWWQSKSQTEPAGAVAISFFSTWLRSRDLAAVDAAIRRLEDQELLPVAVFGYPLEKLTPLLEEEGRFQPRAVIALNATLSSPKDAEIYLNWGVPILNGMVTRESAVQWRANEKGLPADRIAANLSLPERSGLIAPTLAATIETAENGMKFTQPVAEGIARLAGIAKRLLALQTKPNAGKRVALIYYNNPPGKGNIGASYLQVFPSIQNILGGLAAEDYDVQQPLPDEQALRKLIEGNGRNLELWAEGEKKRMAGVEGVVRWPMSEYRRHYMELPAVFRSAVEETWGDPESSKLMTADCGAERCFLFPVLWQGNLLLAPQPLRTTFDQVSDPGHEKVTPPPHQYIAFYLWLREEFQADALVHLGRHGTLEWLPGKQTALAPEDAPSLLLGDLPNFNLYVMDGGGEAIQAKRRAGATLISHLTPMIWRAGGRADIEKLHQSFHELVDRGDSLSPALAAEYEKTTREEVKRLGLDRQLSLDMSGSWKQMAPALHRFLHDIEDSPVPAGLPVFGRAPREEQLRDAVGAYLFSVFPREAHDEVEARITPWAEQLLAGHAIERDGLRPELLPLLERAEKDLPGWIQTLRDSGRAEMAGLVTALSGLHVPSHLLGDPLRKPEALPTGANLHAVESARIPTEAAWRVGQKMAVEFLQRYEESHGHPPKRISLVLWYGETERHQGAMESMAMALLGVRPVWNQRGIVEDLQLMSAEELGRPRVDVVFTVSGNYRDGFPDKLQLLDRAGRLAARASDGVVAGHDRELAARLEAEGMEAGEAKRLSEFRIFGAKPGAYGVGVQYLVEKSGGADAADKISSLYTANMGFGYSSEQWGVAGGPALRANLRSIDAVQFSRSSNLYGSLDNDDTYQYVGGLRTAVAQLAQRAPEVYLHNLRRSGGEKMVSLREWLAVELHSRHFNPKWLREMQKSGYAGARQMTKELEHLYGFQKTSPDHLAAATWQTVMDVFVKDKHKLGLQQFFDKQNPHAKQTLLARLLEVDRQRIHRFNLGDRKRLLVEYARSVAQQGAACSAQICGNRVLRKHVETALQEQGETEAAATMQSALQKALGEKAPPPAPAKDIQQPTLRLSALRRIGDYAITWVKRLPATWTAKPAPWWVWSGSAAIYAAIALLRARERRKDLVSLGIPPVGSEHAQVATQRA